MSKFTPTVIRKTTFQGDEVEVVFRRMQNKHVKIIAPYLGKDDKGQAAMQFTELMDMVSTAKDVFSDCVVSFKGLTDNDGNSVELTQAISEAYFFKLIVWMFNELAAISFVGDDEAKKSGPDSSGSSEGSSNVIPLSSGE